MHMKQPSAFEHISFGVMTLILGTVVGLSACASIPLFPPRATEDIDEYFDFEVWQKAPNTASATK